MPPKTYELRKNSTSRWIAPNNLSGHNGLKQVATALVISLPTSTLFLTAIVVSHSYPTSILRVTTYYSSSPSDTEAS